MQEMLEAELDTTMSYGKIGNSVKQTDNCRTGQSKKKYSDTELLIPRDRERMSKSATGKDLCRRLFGCNLFKVRQEGSIVNKASCMVIGIDLDGRKDVLGMWIGEHETSKTWLVVLNELRNRGVQDILICCVDNLKGFNETIGACFPEAEIQKCVVHQIRNSIRYVSYKDVKKMLADLKPVYTAASEPLALESLENFETVWGNKYPLIINSWRANWPELSAFFKYPPEIRKIIYTTNMIESYHR